MKRLKLVLLVFCLGVVQLAAAKFDGSNPLLCSTASVIECDAGLSCNLVPAGEVNAPRFVKIDFKKKQIKSTPGGKLTSKIEHIETVDGKLILQGIEDGADGVRDGAGWTVAIQQETGDVVVTVAGDRVGFVMFGSCLVQ